jgi:DNA-binding NarL/FixJ family response regulator
MNSPGPFRILLVRSKPFDEVERHLLAAGGEVIALDDGESAIIEAQRARFDMAVLVSTGKGMDLAETVFNLRDVSPSMPIVIIADGYGREADVIARTSSNTRALSADGLAAYLGVPRTAVSPRPGRWGRKYKA